MLVLLEDLKQFSRRSKQEEKKFHSTVYVEYVSTNKHEIKKTQEEWRINSWVMNTRWGLKGANSFIKINQ